MSYDAIKKAALELFATQGYEGTSLSQIADKVGIKKQSIYSHFKNKDELYLQLVEETFDIELRRIRHSLELKAKQPLYDCLLDALSSYMERYQDDYRLKFSLRISFFPSIHLYEQVMNAVYDYIDAVDALYFQQFEQAERNQIIQVDAKTATLSFSALIDSICLELVYGGLDRTKRKLEASWHVYWSGLTKS
ncbi:TetR/AcrR family transcriptional regulator [Alkalihalobacillus pseudalcaliphilus]|uniref:TetR/AcrR family transcriptional regulator n=1 Tax=Alkalihalobacillus pseudalcaliphilus TaxID=79884 RepID=UPI00064D734B|nr:TetR/AcrR family transcriptional regulator [Alkalihalobacillus pseudalcaliphilus]KMK75768.1 TetR family transcriptional regulator [Alkalihalobacillus pseudalcaliphilus]